uniref:Regulator of chromosome condensation protein n=1 Tax=Marseillevirus LCMAC102 TaxID=2506603 RepID=A0A481YTS5_9VIRU|nr:MAG: regulator of chromosome condensation protein [Marseillevirus LCMAC102]
MLGFGENWTGQFGLGDDTEDKLIPTLLSNLKVKAKQVSCAINHTAIIDHDDNVYMFGNNWYGQLGVDSHKSCYTPQLIPNLKAKFVLCGKFYYTIIIDQENNVLTCGNDKEILLGDKPRYYSFTKIPGLKAKLVARGNGHTVIIDLENNMWVYGRNECGQLGLGSTIDSFTLKKNPYLKAKFVSCGAYHTAIIDEKNNVLMCGRNDCGQLGTGDTVQCIGWALIPNLKANSVSCGEYHTVILSH